MSVQGAFILFQRGILRMEDATVDLDGHTLKAALTTSAQAFTNAFVGSSGDCRYADLTAQLGTANGYTVGGLSLPGITLTITGGFIRFTSSAFAWTLTGAGVTFKYLVIYSDTAANKNLLCYCDMDTTGGSVSPLAGSLVFTPHTNGIFRSS